MTNPLIQLFRDDDLLIVHKPADLLVHRSPIDKHETEFALQYAREMNDGEYVYPVHRLDRPTSGVLVFSRSPEVARTLGQAMMAGQVRKTYLAMVRGWPQLEGAIDYPLREEPEDRRLKGQDQPVREARTRYRTLATTEIPVLIEKYPSSRYGLVELYPETGRKHQLRRHMKHISHPIIGDANHGRGRHNRYFAERFGQGRLMLAATDIAFAHPVSGDLLHIHAEPEQSFLDVLSIFPQAELMSAMSARDGTSELNKWGQGDSASSV
ncbi:pseudouridylate synthase [Marinobacter salinexigens]|uniref:tRNA pseudouridine synthase C n=1 Tax=Marinobacter salinexigens TaxID=2919747 RepID=A0A5B0V8Q8_9GAMM|nr:pseudouridine synthase [Marinobacter salinexigens]KAA1170585.1 pseudouridylate synthase [Marinobacter salinexigens]